jgi:putative oxidoreductase
VEKGGISHRIMRNLWNISQKTVKSPYLALLLRLYIGFVFIYAALSKIPYPAEFAESLAAYRVLPYWSINGVAVVLPWIELICGLFLILGLRTRAAASIIASLLTIFTGAIMINVIREAPISCGCFDSIGRQVSWRDIVRDVIWILLTIQIFFFDRIFLLRKVGIFSKERF